MENFLPDTPELGTLTVQEVLLYYDGPRAFTVTNDRGQEFFGLSADYATDDNQSETYILAPQQELGLIKGEFIAFREAILNPLDGDVWVFVLHPNNTYTIIQTQPSALPQDWLPVQ